jgi:UDP-N-acetylmuramoyl-tripeptide--D-alanyl-D-alanine ligase
VTNGVELTTAHAADARGRRIAVLGEMLELGPRGAELHSGLSGTIEDSAVDLVFCAGPLYQGLWEALPSGRKGGYAVNAAALESQVLGAVRAGDAVMIKGSLGSKMGPIVKALIRQFPSHGDRETVAAQG